MLGIKSFIKNAQIVTINSRVNLLKENKLGIYISRYNYVRK